MRKGVKHSTSVAKFRKHGHGEAGAQLYLTQECLELLKLDLATSVSVNSTDKLLNINCQPKIMFNDFDQHISRDAARLIRITSARYIRVDEIRFIVKLSRSFFLCLDNL